MTEPTQIFQFPYGQYPLDENKATALDYLSCLRIEVADRLNRRNQQGEPIPKDIAQIFLKANRMAIEIGQPALLDPQEVESLQ